MELNVTFKDTAKEMTVRFEGSQNDDIGFGEIQVVNTGKIPVIGTITLRASAWSGANNFYSQVVSVENVTEYSQVDITPDAEQLAAFYEKDLALVAENEDGVVTVYAIGQKPTNDYTIQVTITEVRV